MRRTITASVPSLRQGHVHAPAGPRDMFCRECGEPLREITERMYYACSVCDESVGLNEKFCPHCGNSLEDSKVNQFYFLSRQVTKEEYATLRKSLEGKLYKLLRTDKDVWEVRFTETEPKPLTGKS